MTGPREPIAASLYPNALDARLSSRPKRSEAEGSAVPRTLPGNVSAGVGQRAAQRNEPDNAEERADDSLQKRQYS